MIVDSSAIIAILKNEPEASAMSLALENSIDPIMSAASYLEAAIVADGAGNPVVSRKLDQLIYEFGIAIESVTEAQAKIARAAYRDYGKGRGHRAQLNFGDCFAYALAAERNQSMLFKGKDFSWTDIRSALDPPQDPRT